MFCQKCGQELPDSAHYCLNCGVQLGVPGNQAAVKEKGREEYMLEAAKAAVSKFLKSPGSAQYSDLYDLDADDYGRVYAEIAVDSHNSYGAMIRTKFGMIFADITDTTPPRVTYGPVSISLLSSAKIIKTAGKFGKPMK